MAALAVVLAFAVFADSAAVRGLETAALDLRFRLRGVRPPGPDTTVILVDDKSLAALGRWPFSRRYFAEALRRLDAAGAKVVVFDVLFAEPEQPVPADLQAAARAAAAALPPGSNPPLQSALRQLADDDPDADFAAAIRASGNVLLAFALATAGPARAAPDYLSNAAYARFDNSPEKPAFTLAPVAAVAPIAPLATAALGLGHVEVAYDNDGAVRYDYVALPYDGDFQPSIPVRAAAAYLGVPWADVGLALGRGVRIGRILVPTDRAMRLLINYRGPRGTFRTYSFVDLLQGRVPPAALQGRLVLIGGSFTGNADAFATPFGPTPLPGTERLANVIDSILQQDFITPPPPLWALAGVAALLLLAAAVGYATARLPTRLAALAGTAALALWFAAAQAAFLHGLWLPLAQPLAALVAATLGVLLFRYWVIDRLGRRVRTAFQHYMAPAMVNVLAAHPERLKLGGETRNMTLMFCDVRGFTAISEQFKANPQGLTQLINRFLTPVTDIIMARQGTIDKYMGDCVMAFWNAPLDDADHADHACASALAMTRAMADLNRQLKAEAEAGERPYHPLHIGIGVNTGDCVVGNMGSEQRFDYSVLGDAVNLASRLEGQSKLYGVDIVLGETTRTAAPGWAALELDLIAVKGKAEAVRVYTLLGDSTLAATAEHEALVHRHDAMLACYRRRDWKGARRALGEARGTAPRLGPLYDLYEQRIAEYEADPPPAGWNGVFVALSK